MEEEVMGLLIGGFIVVMTISFGMISYLWYKYKKSAYGWFMGHLVSLSIAIIYWLLAIQASRRPYYGMSSEENSIRIAMAGIFWALSMGFMLKGIIKLSSQNKVI